MKNLWIAIGAILLGVAAAVTVALFAANSSSDGSDEIDNAQNRVAQVSKPSQLKTNS